MSTGRKSQVEKFNKKWGAKEAETQMLREAEAKRSLEKDIMKEGEKIMAKTTNNTEEVFAVIARSGMETFMKTWNNSMENVIRETVRTEVKSMVQQIVQEEMEAAVKGVFAGVNDAMKDMFAAQMVEQVFRNPSIPTGEAEQEQIEEELMQEEEFKFAEAEGRVTEEAPRKKREQEGRANSLGWSKMTVEQAKSKMFELLEEAEREHGVDITQGKQFKNLKGKFNTAYQTAMPIIYGKKKRGEKGGWEQLIEEYRSQKVNN